MTRADLWTKGVPPAPADALGDNGMEPTVSEGYPDDIFTEPETIDPDTLANLGPLARFAGVWEGVKGADVNPNPGPDGRNPYRERIEMQPLDPQTNGPQLLYGLHYLIRAEKFDAPETYHHQTGYLLWEPATGLIVQTLAIPRAQVAMAGGHANPGDRRFRLEARRGDPSFAILSGPFLEHAFRTESFSITFEAHADGSWSYEEDTVIAVRGREGVFHHTDRNTLVKVGEPTPNPLMRRS